MSDKLKDYLDRKSDYLNASKLIELGLKNRKLTIEKVEWLKFKAEEKEKLLLSFAGVKEKMVVSRENANMLQEAFGSDEESWKGKDIVLVITKGDFKGQSYDKITIAV